MNKCMGWFEVFGRVVADINKVRDLTPQSFGHIEAMSRKPGKKDEARARAVLHLGVNVQITELRWKARI